MLMSARPTAEERFIATQKKVEKALTEAQKVQQERADQTARLRKLRLAKEAADLEAAAQQTAAKNTKKPHK